MALWEKFSKAELNDWSRQLFSSELTRHGMEVWALSRRPLDMQDTQGRRWEMAVRSSRNNSYSFVEKRAFPMGDRRLIGLAQYQAGAAEPLLLIIPLPLWVAPWGQLGDVLKERDYEGLSANPEWGIDARRDLLWPFRLENVVSASGVFEFPTGP